MKAVWKTLQVIVLLYVGLGVASKLSVGKPLTVEHPFNFEASSR